MVDDYLPDNHANETLAMQPDKQPVRPQTTAEKERIQNRLKRIEGQIRGLQKMVGENRYCVDILVQITAVQAALKKVGFSVLEHHTKTCVATEIRQGNETDIIEELMKVIEQYAK